MSFRVKLKKERVRMAPTRNPEQEQEILEVSSR
jgi:hypothetical protein